MLHVVGFRYGTCVNTLPAVAFDDTLILWWSNNQISECFHCFTPGDRAISVSRITGDANASMIQFLMVSATEVKSLRKVVSDIPHVGGIHEPQMPNMNDRTDEVLRSRGPRPIADGSNDNHASVSSSFRSLSEDQTSNHEPCNSEDVDSDEEPYSFDYMSITKQPEFLGTTYVSNCPYVSSSGIDANTIVDPDELDEPRQFQIPAPLSKCMVMPFASHHAFVNPDHRIVFTYQVGQATNAVIERVNNIFTRDEALQHVDQCKDAMLLELMRWVKHKAWKRGRREGAGNILKSKWVLKWKDIGLGKEKTRKIKARLVAQGFLDQQMTATFAGTSTRWSQRLLLSIAVQMQWSLWSADISEAFLRGLSFEQLHLEEGEELRNVEPALPTGSEHLIRTIEAYHDFDPTSEILILLKPGLGFVMPHAFGSWQESLGLDWGSSDQN